MTSMHQLERTEVPEVEWELTPDASGQSQHVLSGRIWIQTWCTQRKPRTASSFVTDCAFLGQTVDRRSNSVSEPYLSIPSFHFHSEVQLENSLCGSLLLVIHHYHLLTSFYSHSKNTSAIYGQYPTKIQGGGGLKNILFYFQFLFNATLTALQMSAKYARMLLFSLSNINPHLSACSNPGLPQPVCFADRRTDRTRERGVLCVCKARCRCHILDCCTSFFMQSRRLSSVYFWQRGMHSLTAALPNKHSCIYQRQDKTHLIWASSSLFTHSQAVQVFQVHLLETVVLQKTLTLRPSVHSLASFFTDVGAN